MSTPYMNLNLPVVGVEPGPQWATDINNALIIVDQHNHTSGSGQPLGSASLNIDATLNFNTYGASSFGLLGFISQAASLSNSTTDTLYVAGTTKQELWYNDGAGNAVQLTNNGSVNAQTTSIPGLISPASVAYAPLSSTFIWQSDVNTAAIMDFSSAIFRNSVANSFGMTVQPPASLSQDYTITLPLPAPSSNYFVLMSSTGQMAATSIKAPGLPGSTAMVTLTPGGLMQTPFAAPIVPGSTKIMQLTSAGGMQALLDVDNVSLQISANTLSVKAAGIGSSNLISNLNLPGTNVNLNSLPIVTSYIDDPHSVNHNWRLFAGTINNGTNANSSPEFTSSRASLGVYNIVLTSVGMAIIYVVTCVAHNITHSSIAATTAITSTTTFTLRTYDAAGNLADADVTFMCFGVV